MKVLIFNHSLYGGSTGKIASKMYEMLKANGHEPFIIHGAYNETSEDDHHICISSKFQVFVHKIYNCATGYNASFAPTAMKKIEEIIKREKPDIVQFYNLHGYYLDMYKLFRLVNKYNIPAVYGMIDEHPYLGYCTYAYECDQFMTGCQNCTLKIPRGYMNFCFKNRGRETFLKKRKIYDETERIVYTGPEWVVHRAKESMLLRDKDVRVVDEFIDTDNMFYPRDTKAIRNELGIPEDKIIVLNIARSDDKRKGIDSYIEMAGLCKDERYVFLNIGYLGDKSVLPGNYIPLDLEYNQDRLAQYYSLADMLVCTSFADTMPNVCLDALSCGTPVVGFDITGTPYVADEPLGKFVKAGDAKALLEKVLENGKKTDEISAMAREYGKSRYSPEVYYNKSIAIYNELLGR